MNPDSRSVARAAVSLAMTNSREEESALKVRLIAEDIRIAASDFGGEFSSSVMKIIERAVVIARREGLIGDKFHEEGAVAGACHDAIIQISGKAMGLSVGGKVAARATMWQRRCSSLSGWAIWMKSAWDLAIGPCKGV